MRSKLLSRLFAVVLLVLFAAAPAWACPVCYGDPNSPMAKGTNNGIMFLLGVVGFVQIGFVALFVSWWRNSVRLRRKREEFRVIEGGVR